MTQRFSSEFLDALRERIALSELIGQTVSLKRHGREHIGLCPFHEERTPSFSVNDQKRIWCCFGCGAKGDAIDFAMHSNRLSFPDAVRALASEQGLIVGHVARDPQAVVRIEQRRAAEQQQAERRLSAAHRIWNEALPAATSPVERYLRSRDITGAVPFALRYHPELRYRIDEKQWLILPAMVAQVSNVNGDIVAIHRTYLRRDGSDKADVPNAKLMLGDSRGGHIALFDEVPPPGAPPFDLESLAVSEGIENGLSYQQMTGLRTVAAGSTGNLVALELPATPIASQLTLAADNDKNDAGLRAALVASARFRDEGRKVHIHAPSGMKDWNDVLRAQARSGLTPSP